jgi:2,5-furandicarboxylate decarboxylase 1
MTWSLRAVVDELRAGACLREVVRPVDPSWEVTAVLDRLERSGTWPPVLFGSVDGRPGWSLLGNLFADRSTLARLLRVDRQDVASAVDERLSAPIEPEIVTSGVVHERVIIGEDASLDELPIPTHHERDAGPYLSLAVVICKDPDTGARNAGIYRFMQRGPRTMVPSLTSISDIASIFRRQEERGLPLEIAIVPGVHPFVSLAAAYRAPAGVDECALAGGLMGEALPLVPAKTIDVEVPADAEVVLEAKLLPGERFPEAPFADMSRSYSREKAGPLTEITAITHRSDPILQLAFSGHADATNIAAVCQEVAVLRAVRQSTSNVVGVHVPASGFGFHCYLSLRKEPSVEGNERGEQRNAMLAALGAVPQLKLIAAFDHDVDITDETQVLQALARRFQAIDPLSGESRLTVLPWMKGASYDPSSFHREYPNSKVMIDATLRSDLTSAQRASFEEARCKGSDDIDLEAYFPPGEPNHD